MSCGPLLTTQSVLVTYLDEGVRVADGAAVVGHKVGDLVLRDLHLKIVAGYGNGPAMTRVTVVAICKI